MNLWQELRRRRVFRLAGLYVVGAWLAIQVADISFPAWGIPETSIRYLFIAAAACFPLAIIFSWYFDVTANGIVRTRPAVVGEHVDTKLRPFDFALLTVIAAIGLAVLYDSVGRIQSIVDETDKVIERQQRSIAVLPFENLDPNDESGFFSDGITEEIQIRLASLGKLRVLARNSAFALRNSDQSPTQIADTLGVAFLLSGSVRRDNDHVRITAQLLDHQGFSVWTDTFDRKLESIFVIQTEIASAVSGQIINEIVPVEDLPAGRTTRNMDAYADYLVGRAYFDARTPGWRENAVHAFEQAITKDPGFAPPYAGKAMSVAVNAGLGPNVDEAFSLAEHALTLDPNLAEAHAILGLVQAFPTDRQDLAASEQSLRRAIKLDPSLAIAFNWLNFSLDRQGRDEEALEALFQGLEVDPLNGPMVSNAAGYESATGNPERAEKMLLRLLSLPEPPQMARFVLAGIYSEWNRTADELRTGKEILREVEFIHPFMLEEFIFSYDSLGMTSEGDRWEALLHEQIGESASLSDIRLIRLMMQGRHNELAEELNRNIELAAQEDEKSDERLLLQAEAHIQLDQCEPAVVLIESVIDPDFDELIREHSAEDVVDVSLNLVYCYRKTGRAAEASQILDSVLNHLAPTVETGASPSVIIRYAQALTLSGDLSKAMVMLGLAVEEGWNEHLALTNDMKWRPLIAEPSFREIETQVEQATIYQREQVMSQDAGSDFVAEVRARLAMQREHQQQ